MRETPLDTSLCAPAIVGTAFLEIPDTLRDHRMADDPLCLGDPGQGFCAGALLTTDEGHAIGTLCVLDTRPRQLTGLQRNALQVLARQVMKQLNLRVAVQRMDLLRRGADHRVKNSLSMIGALIRLQWRGAVAEETRSALQVVQHRIDTVAALHTALCDVGNGMDVDIGACLTEVTANLRGTLPRAITLNAAFAPCRIAASQAANVALIVSEWLINAARHAFPQESAGRIDLSGGIEGKDCTVIVRDDGVGMVRDRRPGGIGMGVIDASTAQVSGTITRLAQGRGTGWCLRFPINAAAHS